MKELRIFTENRDHRSSFLLLPIFLRLSPNDLSSPSQVAALYETVEYQGLLRQEKISQPEPDWAQIAASTSGPVGIRPDQVDTSTMFQAG